jgi:hypothetical protein
LTFLLLGSRKCPPRLVSTRGAIRVQYDPAQRTRSQKTDCERGARRKWERRSVTGTRKSGKEKDVRS